MDELKKTTVAMALEGGLIRNKEDLTARIIDIITNPNEAWREAKKDYQLPPKESGYFFNLPLEPLEKTLI
jgi:hypothetical protein